MTNVKYHALLSSRFSDLSDLIYKNCFDRYFYAMDVAGYLYNAVYTEEDILVSMMLAAGLAEWSCLTDEENRRVIRIAKARATDTKLDSADTGILAALPIVDLRDAIDAYERAGKGVFAGDYIEKMQEKGKAFDVLSSIYEQVKDHPMGSVLSNLIHRAMEISNLEAKAFFDERPVYEITPTVEGSGIPTEIVSLVEKMYLCYSSQGNCLYVSGCWYKDRKRVPALATLIQAHHPELLVVKSSKKFSAIDWNQRRCQSWMEAVHRQSIFNLIDQATNHKENCMIDPYLKLSKLFKL